MYVIQMNTRSFPAIKKKLARYLLECVLPL